MKMLMIMLILIISSCDVIVVEPESPVAALVPPMAEYQRGLNDGILFIKSTPAFGGDLSLHLFNTHFNLYTDKVELDTAAMNVFFRKYVSYDELTEYQQGAVEASRQAMCPKAETE